eukprot:1147362-Pelagomonas_calceolata.AAC.7
MLAWDAGAGWHGAAVLRTEETGWQPHWPLHRASLGYLCLVLRAVLGHLAWYAGAEGHGGMAKWVCMPPCAGVGWGFCHGASILH